MKTIDTSAISTTAGLPGKSGVLNHLQQSFKEILTALGQYIAGSPTYSTSVVYVLYGCVDSGSGLAHTISAGYVFFNGEFYQVDGVSFVSTAGQVAIASIVTTFATGAAGDPVGFTDGSSHNVLQIRKVVISSGVSGTGGITADFTAWKRNASPSLATQLVASYGTTQTVNFTMDQAYFYTVAPLSGTSTLNFDMTGAVPGTVITLKLVMPIGSTFNIASPAGTDVYNFGGAVGFSHTNFITCEYVGLNNSGNMEIRYSIATV